MCPGFLASTRARDLQPEKFSGTPPVKSLRSIWSVTSAPPLALSGSGAQPPASISQRLKRASHSAFGRNAPAAMASRSLFAPSAAARA